MKTCSRCGEEKKLGEFTKNKSRKDGYSDWCKSCRKIYRQENPKVIREANKRYHGSEKYKQVARNNNLRSKYGITQEDYLEILKNQGGGCKICGKTSEQQNNKPLSVDHCHETGVIRGLLCDHCNTGLGKLGDNARGLRRALQYLINSGDNSLYRDEYAIEATPENREYYFYFDQKLRNL